MKVNEKANYNLTKCFVFVILLMFSAMAFAQKPNKPSEPQSHSAPSRPSAPAHATAPSHPTAPSHATAPGRSAPGAHPATPSHATTPGSTGRPGTTTAGRPGTGTASRPGTNTAAKTGGPAGRPGTAAAGRPAGGAPGRPGNTPAGHVAANRTPPGRQVSLKGGGSASIRPNGQIRSINRNGMQIQHGLHGGRTVVSQRNGAKIVTTGKHGGYVQRNYVSRNGHTYVSRTYVVNNVSYTSVYRSYGYGGYCCYYGYAPAYYYNPGYYGWAYNPWPAPAPYAWGWGGSPWYGYYGGYFAPYPVYPSAAFWLTDYLVAASLRAAYEAQAEANAKLSPLGPEPLLVASMGPIPAAANSNAVALTPEVKQAIADEVKAQLAAEQAEAGKGASSGGQQAASGEVPPALDPKRRTFVVSTELSAVADGDECSLTAGDVISRISDTPDDDKNLDVKVLASKKDDCAVGKQVAVSIDDLQEMYNHFREQLTGGMGELAKKQGTGGLPKAPDTSTVAGEVPAPPADTTAAKALQEQQSSADQTESQVKQEAGGSNGGGQ